MTGHSLPGYGFLADDTRAIARGMALRWTWLTQTQLLNLLRSLGSRSTDSGKAFTSEQIKACWSRLKSVGLLEEHSSRAGYVRLVDDLRTALYRELLDQGQPDVLRDAMYNAENARDNGYQWPFYSTEITIAVVRLAVFSGTDAETLARMQSLIARQMDWSTILHEACYVAFEPTLFKRISPALRWDMLFHSVHTVCSGWSSNSLPMALWAEQLSLTDLTDAPPYLRLQLAEWMLHRGDQERMNAYLNGEEGGSAAAIRAAALAQSGQWEKAQTAFEAALKQRQAEASSRKRVFPESLAWYYPLTLLARQSPKALAAARKFCLNESGSRTPPAYGGWGLWVHAIGARLGEGALVRSNLEFQPHVAYRVDLDSLWKLMLRAWVGSENPGSPRDIKALESVVAALHLQLRKLGMIWLDDQVSGAHAVILGREAPAGFFVSGGEEAWRNVLASLMVLGDESKATGKSVAGSGTRLLWSLRLGKGGRVEAIEPMEQKQGPRGWGKAKGVSLSRLAGNEKLSPWDAKVAQCIRTAQHPKRTYLDHAAGIMALVGHPAVVLADTPDTTLDVIEGTPQMEVLRQGDQFVMHITPSPHPDVSQSEEYRYYMDEAQRKETEALRYITVIQDSPQRLRVIRFTPAQRRAAQLVSGRFAVPSGAQDELQTALRALAGHFDIHSDHAAAAREEVAQTQLRAELSPKGDGLLLRLVAAPLGTDGPRLMPGQGRERVMAAIKGESVGTQRDLGAEQSHLDTVMERLPFLTPPRRGDSVCEWAVDDPEMALSMVEILPLLPGIASVDWPRGKPVRVTTIDATQLTLTVKTERDWFRIDGQAKLDEGRVFELQALLSAAAGKSRFVALGEGAYLALSTSLRERLVALSAVMEADKAGLKVPQLASAWLEDTLDGITVETDKAFRERVERLRKAQDTHPAVPKGLQAELRPYQEDGFLWAARLAEAGFGACLADDMGLGKTVQALAILIARASGGPALVVAPTSVCGNWLAEAARFAPGLNVRIYGESARTGVIEGLQAGDVLIVSYTMVQQAAEAFSARTWHTLVADEAQAIKNAAAKRSQALFDVPADFRLALSGTPVENRLAELWSIMRFCNAGLLGSLARFNERFAGPIERDRDRDAQRLLRRLIAPFVMRRTKAQVLQDLPPRTELVLAITPEADEAAHYEALRRLAIVQAQELAGQNSGQARLHILAQLTKLRRAACDPRLTTPDLAYVGAKVRAFAELAGELVANGHKALVFSQFVDFLTLLREPLDAAGISYQYLDGSTPPTERTRRVAAFQAGEGDLFLISLKAGGFGLNLTAADYVVITDPWWNPAADDQAMGRAHRIGQQRPVTVYRLVSKGTLEERIVELHHDKRALADGVLAETETDLALPSTDDLLALMRELA